MDYLGGHGSRGYGKVAFSDFEVVVREGECPEDVNLLLNILKEVEEYGVLSVNLLAPHCIWEGLGGLVG